MIVTCLNQPAISRALLRYFFVTATLLLAASSTLTALAGKMPSFDRVEGVFERHFESLADYQAGDLISESDVIPLFDQLKILGWRVKDRNRIMREVLSDGDFLVVEFHKPRGRKFMRDVAGYRNVYDRLDRLSKMPGGTNLITGMIGLPNGADLLKEHPTPGLKSLTQLLPKGVSGRTPKDPHFNERTGRIYTEKDLLEALEESYKQTLARAR